MTKLGYTLSSEEFGPMELVDIAVQAEEAGFDFLSISDHFHPWISAQGESPFVWSTLGAIATATDQIEVGVGVTCPTTRIHPVNVAHAVATVDEMFGDRFTFGVGTGENLNEHVTGERWPEHDVRLEMLDEAMDVMRSLWTGETTSHHGEYYTVENARLFTVPDEQPTTIGSAFGPQTAEWVAETADGLWWCSGPKSELVEAYEDAGGDGPKYTQLHGCYADSEEAAIETIYEQWPNGSIFGRTRSGVADAGTLRTGRPDGRESGHRRGRNHHRTGPAGPHRQHRAGDRRRLRPRLLPPDRAGTREGTREFYEKEVLPSFG